jgi:hypothetical protein
VPQSNDAARASTRMTKKELVEELEEARRRISALERAAAERDETDDASRLGKPDLAAIADNLPGMVYRRINHVDGRVSYP